MPGAPSGVATWRSAKSRPRIELDWNALTRHQALVWASVRGIGWSYVLHSGFSSGGTSPAGVGSDERVHARPVSRAFCRRIGGLLRRGVREMGRAVPEAESRAIARICTCSPKTVCGISDVAVAAVPSCWSAILFVTSHCSLSQHRAAGQSHQAKRSRGVHLH